MHDMSFWNVKQQKKGHLSNRIVPTALLFFVRRPCRSVICVHASAAAMPTRGNLQELFRGKLSPPLTSCIARVLRNHQWTRWWLFQGKHGIIVVDIISVPIHFSFGFSSWTNVLSFRNPGHHQYMILFCHHHRLHHQGYYCGWRSIVLVVPERKVNQGLLRDNHFTVKHVPITTLITKMTATCVVYH